MRISLTYFLYTIEEGLHLLRPFALGFSVDQLLGGNPWGIWMIAVQHAGWLVVSTSRRLIDTRTFAGIYTRLAAQVVEQQQQQGISDSTVIARASLSRKLVDFFEHDITSLLTSVYNVIGALIILSFYDLMLVLYCLVLFIPMVLLNRRYQRQVTYYTEQQNNQQEREVAEINSRQPKQIQHHYEQLRLWRIRLSDAEALTYGWMELFILGLIIAACCIIANPALGLLVIFWPSLNTSYCSSPALTKYHGWCSK